MYNAYVMNLLNDPNFTKIKTDVAYLFHKNNRPLNLVSKYPIVENKYYQETMDETLHKLVSHFKGQPDPSNEGKYFAFNFMPDFFLDTIERKQAFVYLSKKMTLPDRLTRIEEAFMDAAGELPKV